MVSSVTTHRVWEGETILDGLGLPGQLCPPSPGLTPRAGKEPPGCTRLLGRCGLGVTDHLPPGTGICRCLAAPLELSQRLPTHSGSARGSSGWLRPAQGGLWPRSWGCPWRLPHGTASPLPGLHFICPFALLWSGGMGREEPGSAPDWRTHHLTQHPPRDLGLVPLLPALAASPTGPAAAREPLLRPCISRQVLLNKYPIAMQGGSRVPSRFERPHKPGPLRPSWNCYLSPVPTRTLCQPRPLALCLPGSAAAAPAAP